MEANQQHHTLHAKEGRSFKAQMEINDTILYYESFINDVLKRDLQKVIDQRDEIYSKVAEYLQLKRSIEQFESKPLLLSKKSAKVMTDIGCNFYCQAKITDTSKVLIAVGFGFFVEFTLKEGIDFISKKMDTLTKQTEKLTMDIAKIKALIKLVLSGLTDLQHLDFANDAKKEAIF
eukprot:gene10896-19725_t